jgi:hypothetical protein
MEDNISPVYSQQAVEFVAVANEFCKFIEGATEMSTDNFIEISHKILPLLYLKGTMLPEIDETYEEFNEKFVTEDDYIFIQNNLAVKFGKFNTFDEIFDPLRQENDEPVQLNAAEQLADIYQDIKDFIMQYKDGTNEIMSNALWECRQTFEQYWGQRIVNLLRYLHYLKYTIVELETDNEDNGKNPDKEFNYDKIDTGNWLISRMQEDYEDEE